MCFHVTAINENVSRVYLYVYDILVCFAMYLMRPTYRYCSFTLSLLDLTLKVKEGTLFFTRPSRCRQRIELLSVPATPF